MCWVEGKDLYQKNEKDIIGQYISRKVLRGYLISEEQEVVDIMMAFCRGCYRRQVFGCLVWVSCFRWEFPSDTGCSRCGFPLLFACFGRGLFFVFGLGRMHCFKADALFLGYIGASGKDSVVHRDSNWRDGLCAGWHGVSGGFPVYSAGAFVRGVELENLWKGADFLEVSAYIMRVGKTGEVYQGYLGEADVSLLEPGYIYLLGGGLAVVCVEDAVVQGETLNRAVYDGDGNFRAVLAGNLAAVRYGGGCFKDVCKEDIASLEKILKPVERIAYGRVCLKASSTLPVWEGK